VSAGVLPFRATSLSETYDGLRRLPVSIVLDRVRSLYNVGAFFRTCDAAAAERLYLTGYTGCPPDPRISKTALGAEEAVAWERHEDAAPLLGQLRLGGVQIAVAETSARAVDLYDWRPAFPVCVVFGNEVEGVTAETAARADVHIRLPMLGVKESLNVAVAGGVVLFELLRKYRELLRGG